MNIEQTNKVIAELFGTDRNELLKNMGLGHLLQSDPDYVKKLGTFGAHWDGDLTRGVQISFGFKAQPLIRFTIQHYPACCGINMLHTFFVKEGYITQEKVDAVLSVFFRENKYPNSGALGRNNRLEVVMVEIRGLQSAEAADELEFVENPIISYKHLWNFFHKFSKKVRTRLMVNINTGNVLHNMEVILF